MKMFLAYRARVEALLAEIFLGVKKMSTQLDSLTAAVAQNTSVTQSAIALIQGLKVQLDAAIAADDDGAALQALSDSLGTQSTALAQAVAANTPPAAAAPAPAGPSAGTVAQAQSPSDVPLAPGA